MISTFLVLRAFGALGKNVKNCAEVRRAVNWINTKLINNCSYTNGINKTPDPCSTVRAWTGLAAVDGIDGAPVTLNGIQKYLREYKPHDGFWEIQKESYVPDQAPGQVFFSLNAGAEILQFGSDFEICTGECRELARWFLENQNEDGSWYIGANEVFETDGPVMWSTADAVRALQSATSLFFRLDNFNRKTVRENFLLLELCVLSVCVGIFWVQFAVFSVIVEFTEIAWGRLSHLVNENLGTFVLGMFASIAGALALAITGNLLKRRNKVKDSGNEH